MSDDKKEITLRVAEAYYRDVGRGIARVDPEAMAKLGLQSGDVIEIVGKSSVPAIVWPGYPEDRGKGIIRIDGSLRSNAGVGIDDRVRIRKVEAKPAEKVTLAPTEPVRLMGGEAYLLRLLEGRPVTRGQKIRVELFGHTLTFVVTATKPAGVVIVSRNTAIELKDKPVEGVERAVPNVTYEDIGGLKRELRLVREMIELPLKHPEIFQRLGIDPPKGVLLYGPPGTGKTLIAKAVANEVNAHFISISGPEIMSKYYGESEQRLREIFEEAKENAPSIIFIDEIDSIAPRREDVTGEVERRVVAQLLTLMDGLEERGQVIVIGATNRIDAVDPALRRPGRFDREIEIGVPDREGRFEILQIHTRNMPLEPEYRREFVLPALHALKKSLEEDGKDAEKIVLAIEEVEDAEKEEEIRTCIEKLVPEDMRSELDRNIVKAMLQTIADQTHGFVGADIEALCKEAAMVALRRYLPKIDLNSEELPADLLESIRVTMDDFKEAMKGIEPSAMREVLVEIPKVSWEDVGGLEDIKREVIEAVEWPLKYPEKFKKFGIRPPKGVLLYGPPGTGKTLIAKAVANESNANFISVKGSELLSKWLGESEKAVRKIFRKARQVAPCIIFFDEIDAIAPVRGFEEGTRAVERVVNQLLTEMDGLEDLEGVMVIGATNRPDMLDPALLRPGRFDRLVYVRPPDKKSRLAIFRIHTRNMPLRGVDLMELAELTEGYVGADIEAVCREAVMLAMRENIDAEYVERRHFMEALKKVKPSITDSMMSFYERFEEKSKQERAKVTAKGIIGYG